jgi:hypothetical protein
MTKADIRSYRRWHRDAALRARRAGFNIIYGEIVGQVAEGDQCRRYRPVARVP